VKGKARKEVPRPGPDKKQKEQTHLGELKKRKRNRRKKKRQTPDAQKSRTKKINLKNYRKLGKKGKVAGAKK